MSKIHISWVPDKYGFQTLEVYKIITGITQNLWKLKSNIKEPKFKPLGYKVTQTTSKYTSNYNALNK